jgi:hypothetical protein
MALKHAPALGAWRTWGAGLALLATLSACGTRAEDPVFTTARGLIGGAIGADSAAPTVDPRAILTREAINAVGVPLTLVEVANTGDVATLLRVATNGGNETWQIGAEPATAVTVTLTANGVLRATRGLGHDLYATDIGTTEQALRTRSSAPLTRTYIHVNGALESVPTPVTCQMSFGPRTTLSIFNEPRSLTPVTEICTYLPTQDTFTNTYNIDTQGFIWSSSQYAGQNTRNINFERLHR